MPMGGNGHSTKRNMVVCCLIGVIYFVVCLYFPDWMPRCLLRFVTGYDCPACGAQRAIRCFATGELYAGFWCNPYLIVISPYILLLIIAEIGGSRTSKLHKWLTNTKVVLFLVIIMFGWWIMRNTPLWGEITDKYGVQ